MSIFSDKYKSAQDKLKISDDFISRTEKMMISLRDSGESESNARARRNRRAIVMKTMSAVTAAAACIGAIIIIEQTSESGIMSRTTSDISTESVDTDITLYETAEEIEDKSLDEEADETDNGLSAQAELATETAVSVTEEEFVEETAVETTAVEIKKTEAARTEAVTEPVKDVVIAEPQTSVESEASSETALSVVSAADIPVAEGEEPEEADGSESDLAEEVVVSEEGGDVVVSEISYTPEETASEAMSKYRSGNYSLTITPNVDITDTDGKNMSYHEAVTISADSEANREELAALGETLDRFIASDANYTVVSGEMQMAMPEYILDLVDPEGNEMRIYIGGGEMYINRYSSETVLAYVIALSEQEYTDLEMYLIGMVD